MLSSSFACCFTDVRHVLPVAQRSARHCVRSLMTIARHMRECAGEALPPQYLPPLYLGACQRPDVCRARALADPAKDFDFRSSMQAIVNTMLLFFSQLLVGASSESHPAQGGPPCHAKSRHSECQT